MDSPNSRTAWAVVSPEIIKSATALFLNGICILLAVLALYFLVRRRSAGRHVFVCAIVVLSVFAIAQMIHQVVITGLMLRLYSVAAGDAIATAWHKTQSSIHNLARIKELSDLLLILINNFAADALLIYRCYVIWDQSRYKGWVFGLPLILLIFTTVFGCVAIVQFVCGGPCTWTLYTKRNALVVALGLLTTNLLLTGLIAGRIWATRRDIRAVGRTTLLERYDTVIAMLLESGVLYCATILTLLVAQLVGGTAAFDAPALAVLCGASAQLLNIMPALIFVRVGLARSRDPAPTPQIEVKLEYNVDADHEWP
ncbi:hypothetical protein FB451DRAFT_1283677 [Mycena latifolia]|nr:hypothetical protein FB451DRAFT_1283677 [Mycena latifolia]